MLFVSTGEAIFLWKQESELEALSVGRWQRSAEQALKYLFGKRF